MSGKRWLLALHVLVLLIVTSGFKKNMNRRESTTQNSNLTTSRWYGKTSPWNTPIPAHPKVMKDSPRWMEALAGSISQININQGAWTPTVFYASPGTPRQTITLDNDWRLDDVPVPSDLAPSNDSDAHALIIDLERRREYDFFALRKGSRGGWHAHAGVVFRTEGSGWWKPDPWAARASGAALGGGLLRFHEVRRGKIEHALAAAIPKHLIADRAVAPATTSDGSGGAQGIPMGSRLQLDPGLDVNNLGLEPGEWMIARAMQTYGVYVVDSSSAFALYAQNFILQGKNPYPHSWSNGLTKVLIYHMRVVTPPHSPVYDHRLRWNQPHRDR